MVGFLQNIEETTKSNTTFRTVLYTGQHQQLVVMSLQPGEDIGMEVHEIVDQFIRIESGEGKLILNGEEHLVRDGDAFVIPAKTQHNVINMSAQHALQLYTIYAPPHHKDGTIHKTKQDAVTDAADHI